MINILVEPGNQFKPKNTSSVRKCGIKPTESKGYVVLVGNGFISFHLESGDLTMEARTNDEIFKQHFVLTGEMADLETLAIPKKHFTKNFPTDFM